MKFDVIVVGVGGMGSAAVYYLASRGARVLGVEQFGIPHDRGSSHGHTRIIRLAYWEHPDYVPLVVRALQLWKELEEEVSERLFTRTGSIDAGPPSSRSITGALQACADHALTHEYLTASEVNARFPGYALPEGCSAVHQPDGGFLFSERCIVAHAAAARKLDAEIHTGERVVGWTVLGDRVEVTTDQGRYEAGQIVITAGPWLPEILPSLSSGLQVERQVVLWTWPLRPAHFDAGRFPVFYMDSPSGAFYGLPLDPERGFKFGKYHHRREDTTADGVDRTCYPEDEAVLREGIAKYFPDANGPTAKMETCLFTNTPDQHFIVGRLPGQPRILVAGGFSGHGYKFCSVIGEILAELVLDGSTTRNLDLFAVGRFET